jgi:hypothetical protein
MLTISYGVGNSVQKPETGYQNIQAVTDDPNIQAVLGYEADQVEARVNGQVVDPYTAVQQGMVIQLVKKAGRKSAWVRAFFARFSK